MADLDREIEQWREEAFAAKRRELAMFALGVSAGLRWAKEHYEMTAKSRSTK